MLHSDPRLRDGIRGGGGAAFEPRIVEDWNELLDSVRSAAAAAVVVVDPYEGMADRTALSPDLSAFLHRFPSVAVVAAMEIRPGSFEHLRKLGEWGAIQVICLDEEETAVAIRHRLHATRGRPLRDLVERSLPVTTNGQARAILGVAAGVVSEGGKGSDLAKSLNITPRTLLRWCRRAGLPPPKQLLAWMRIMLAAELLDDPGRTVLDVALACGYSADSSLRHAMHTFLQMSPNELRADGAFSLASEAFLTALADAREERRRYRRRVGRESARKREHSRDRA